MTTSRVPELQTLNESISRIRIPPSMDVPVTRRVRRIIDCPPMRRLASLSQLGLVSLVYPGATHSRLEHSLGVYANALSLLQRLPSYPGESDAIAQEAFLVAALVHDAGHWPFCHPIEDMGDAFISLTTAVTPEIEKAVAPVIPMKHESRVEALLNKGPLADLLTEDWQCNADDVMAILRPKTFAKRPQCQISANEVSFYASCLSGPIDVDKLDYLQRDSLHAGVPYGRNFDAERLVGSLIRHPNAPKLAINEKGRTAAEMMVFGRYVMFSEVYWHHTVRSATAMLQRALFELHRMSCSPLTAPENAIDLRRWAGDDDRQWIDRLRRAAQNSNDESIQRLVEGLFGSTRDLLKRVAQFNVESGDSIHALLSRRPYDWLVNCSRRLAQRMNEVLATPVPESLVLIDAPPVKLEVDINMDVIDRQGQAMTLGDVSPVASVLANRQFDNHVKRVRVFVPQSVRDELRSQTSDVNALIHDWLSDETSGER